MTIDKFHLNLFDLLESIIYIYNQKTNDIVFVNKKAKKILLTEDMSAVNIPKNIYNKFIKYHNFEKNIIIKDDEYILYNNDKYSVNRIIATYENIDVVICICDKITELKSLFQKKDLLIESIKIFSEENEIFDAVYKIMNFISTYYSSDYICMYENVTDAKKLGCFYELDNITKNKVYTTNEEISFKIKKWLEILGNNSLLIIENIEFLKSNWEEKYLELKEKNVKNLVVIGVNFLDISEGILCLQNIDLKNDFSMLSSIVHFILNEIKRKNISKKLNFMSYHDIATGLGNRNKYNFYLDNIKYNAIKSFGIAILDINNLKEINEKKGRNLGDKAILQIGNCLKKFFRLMDIYRIGGDEFIIICENIGKDEFFSKINHINKYFIDYKEYSISIGYIWKDKNLNLPDLISEADKLMYIAKESYIENIRQNKKIVYSFMATQDENGKFILTIGHDNSLDFENKNISFKKKQEIFKYKVTKMLEECTHQNFIMVMLDVNNFKAINEMYGFKVGNKILTDINKAINNNIYEDGVCFHIYSDKYFFCTSIDSFDEIEDIINRIDEEININNPNMKITISYGINKVDDCKINVDTICEGANYAHKICKKQSISNFVFYDEKMKEDIVNEKRIEDDMDNAIQKNEFKLYLQPKYNIFSQKIVGAEALVRWQHTKKGLICPSNFINIFEKNGFIIKLDFYMLEEVCKFIKKNEQDGYKNVPISINMSKLNFKKKDFKDKVLSMIKKYDVNPRYIELEIIESLVIENEENIINIIEQFKAENVSISIDDFGSGYSSLNVLQNLPVDILKIDGQFFKNLRNSKKGKAIIKSIVMLAREIDVKVIAEGVENEDDVQFLKEIGCQIIQGHYFSKPISLQEFIDKVKKY